MATSRKLLAEEIISVTNSVVRLDTLLSGAALQHGINRLTVHNIDAAVNLEILYKSTAATSGAMDIIKPDGSKSYEHEETQLHNLWVYAASSIKVSVKQDGP